MNAGKIDCDEAFSTEFPDKKQWQCKVKLSNVKLDFVSSNVFQGTKGPFLMPGLENLCYVCLPQHIYLQPGKVLLLIHQPHFKLLLHSWNLTLVLLSDALR